MDVQAPISLSILVLLCQQIGPVLCQYFVELQIIEEGTKVCFLDVLLGRIHA